MAITPDFLKAIPTSFATVSIGSTDDPLRNKLRAISTAGFSAIELGFPDLLSFAKRRKEDAEDDYSQLCIAATFFKQLCQQHSLRIPDCHVDTKY